MDTANYLLIFAIIVILLVFLFSRQKPEDPEVRARRLEEEQRARREAEEERNQILSRAVPPDIQRDMREFLNAGAFFGEEHSPLAYVGYKVGKTNGLAPWDRKRRLKVCFQTEIPRELAAKYQSWGRPATYQRLSSICQHLSMLADMRRQRRSYEHAVADWEADNAWFRSEYGEQAARLRRGGFSR